MILKPASSVSYVRLTHDDPRCRESRRCSAVKLEERVNPSSYCLKSLQKLAFNFEESGVALFTES